MYRTCNYNEVGYDPETLKLIEARIKEVDKYVEEEDITYMAIDYLIKRNIIPDVNRVLGVEFNTQDEAIVAICNYYKARDEYDGDSKVYPLLQMMMTVDELATDLISQSILNGMSKHDKEAVRLSMLSCLGCTHFIEELFELIDGAPDCLLDSINTALDVVYVQAYKSNWKMLMTNTNKINSIIVRFFEGVRFDINDKEGDEEL